MTHTYQSILVANEDISGLDAALAKAADLEHYSGAELTLLEVIYDSLEKESDSILPRLEKEQLISAYMAAERHALTELAKCYSKRVATLNTAVSWSESREVGICRYGLQHDVDLVIKPLDAERSPLGKLRPSSVHRLLARVACPVLISKVPNWDDNAAVLACVDVADDHHRALNEVVVHNALLMAELLGMPLHLLHVTPPPQLSLGRFSASFDVVAMHERMLAEREKELQRLHLGTAGSKSEVFYHISSGGLVEEIQTLADSIGANIVTMGTVSREGLRRYLIGNSAETVLDGLDADLLCVREHPLEHTEYAD